MVNWNHIMLWVNKTDDRKRENKNKEQMDQVENSKQDRL